MVAAVAEISHLRTACSYQASPFVTMVALRPIFRPIGAAAPAFGPLTPSAVLRPTTRESTETARLETGDGLLLADATFAESMSNSFPNNRSRSRRATLRTN